MSLLAFRPFVNARLSCASALILFAALISAQAQSQTFTVTEPLLSVSGSSVFSASNFNSSLGTLVDVSLTLKVDHRTFTVFSTENPSSNWINLAMTAPGKTAKINSASLVNSWGNSAGMIDLTYTKPTTKTVASMGVAGLLLYCTPRNNTTKYLDVNYTYDVGSPTNPNTGGNSAVPEPSAKYLAVLAAGVMAALLVSRSRRQVDAA